MSCTELVEMAIALSSADSTRCKDASVKMAERKNVRLNLRSDSSADCTTGRCRTASLSDTEGAAISSCIWATRRGNLSDQATTVSELPDLPPRTEPMFNLGVRFIDIVSISLETAMGHLFPLMLKSDIRSSRRRSALAFSWAEDAKTNGKSRLWSQSEGFNAVAQNCRLKRCV
jgi:hypothetical protein